MIISCKPELAIGSCAEGKSIRYAREMIYTSLRVCHSVSEFLRNLYLIKEFDVSWLEGT